MRIADVFKQYVEHMFSGRRCQAHEVIFAAHDRGVGAGKLLTSVIWPSMEQVEQLYRDDRISRVMEHMATRINRMIADQLHGFLPRKPKSGKSSFDGRLKNEYHSWTVAYGHPEIYISWVSDKRMTPDPSKITRTIDDLPSTAGSEKLGDIVEAAATAAFMHGDAGALWYLCLHSMHYQMEAEIDQYTKNNPGQPCIWPRLTGQHESWSRMLWKRNTVDLTSRKPPTNRNLRHCWESISLMLFSVISILPDLTGFRSSRRSKHTIRICPSSS